MPSKPPSIRPTPSRTPAIGPKRESACQRGYDRRWRKAAAGFLAEHPLCAECERQGKVAPAECVDHIVPHRGDMELFWDVDNWQGLCIPHHQQKTARGE